MTLSSTLKASYYSCIYLVGETGFEKYFCLEVFLIAYTLVTGKFCFFFSSHRKILNGFNKTCLLQRSYCLFKFSFRKYLKTEDYQILLFCLHPE